jgi:hypothetical protein
MGLPLVVLVFDWSWPCFYRFLPDFPLINWTTLLFLINEKSWHQTVFMGTTVLVRFNSEFLNDCL